MHCKYRVALIVRFIVAVALIGAFSGPLAGTANAGDNSVVKVALDEVVSGIARIRVNPRDAKIWRDNPKKPQQVLWWMVKNRTSYPSIMWEFRHAPSNGEDTEDYFGNVDIGCGETEVIAQPVKMPEEPNVEWTYSITAYACKRGVKAQMVATGNAKIIWKD